MKRVKSKNRRNRWGYLALVILLIISSLAYLVINRSKAEAAATVDTSTSATSTADSYQRKTFYDAGTSLYWAFYSNGSAIAYANSSNGTSWTNRGTTGTATSDFSVWNVSGLVYLDYAGSGVTVEKGTLGATSITWSGSTVATTTTSHTQVNIALDSTSHIWIVYYYVSGTFLRIGTEESTNASDTTSWGAEHVVVTLPNTSILLAPSLVPMTTSGNMYFVYESIAGVITAGDNFSGVLYTAAGSSYGSAVTIANSGGGSGVGATSGGLYSLVAGAGDTVHLAYVDMSTSSPINGTIKYIEYSSGAWGSAVSLDSNTTNSVPEITIDASGNLYAWWIRSNTIFYKKGVSPYASGNWDASPTSFYATGTNASLSTSYTSGNSAIEVLWTQGTGSPYNVEYGSLSLSGNSPPATPSLSTPSSGATGVSITPVFTLSTTDPDSDYIEYRIYLYQSDCSTAVGSSPFAETSSQTGWSGQNAGPGSNTAYSSGSTATYTYQGSLSYSTTYCWKADATDPGGSNTYSSTSSTQLFTTQAVPGGVQINGGTTIHGGTTIQ